MDHLHHLTTLLHQIEQVSATVMEPLPHPPSLAEVERRLAQRRHLQTLLQTLEQTINELPALPDPEAMAWAQALLALPTSLILEVDTTRLGSTAELIRLVLVRPSDGQTVFDQILRPQQGYDPAALAYNGLTPFQLEQAPDLATVWPAFAQQVRGQFLISWNWVWDVEQLSRASRRLGYGAPILLGIDLQEPARTFFEQPYAGLPTLCRLIDASLPQPATALERARGQLAILRAMAEGRLGPLHEQEEVDEGDLEALDDLDDTQPF
jgi:DNA polymerase III epsilon subunit-like protein